MPAFLWDNCFVTGLADVDAQHQRLVDVINRFGEVLMRHESAGAADIEKVFGELAAYAQYHFVEEEGLMRRSRLDDRALASHIAEHRSFLEEVTRMHAGMTGNNLQAAQSLLKFLTQWLAYHILGSDQGMARQLAVIAAGTSPGDAYLAAQKVADPATATLLNSLNGLFHEVSERNRELFELNQTLEARVRERTRELHEANARLEDIAMTDVLTGLPNRRHALRRLEQDWREADGQGTPLSCMMIDADGFKQINDTCGHEAGDEVLRRLSRQLQGSLRTDDTVCRLGGDEFLVICPRTPLAGALKIAEAMRQEVASLRVAAGTAEWHGSISVGVAARTVAMQGYEDLMRKADEGVYLAKRNGRNCVATVAMADPPERAADD